MVKKALLVGITYKGTQSALSGCINDIERIKDTLIAEYGFSQSDIIMLRDDSTDAKMQPTRANILTALYQVTHQKIPHLTEIWFYYSGHGSQMIDRNGDEVDGLDEVLVPVDCDTHGPITDDELYHVVKDTPCKTLMFVDACHSGSMCDLAYEVEMNADTTLVWRHSNTPSRQTRNPHIISISGCRDTQTSMDVYSIAHKKSGGAFTDALLDSLSCRAYKGDILQVYTDTCKTLKERGFTQWPILSMSAPKPVYTFTPVPRANTPSPTPSPSPTPNTKSPTLRPKKVHVLPKIGVSMLASRKQREPVRAQVRFSLMR